MSQDPTSVDPSELDVIPSGDEDIMDEDGTKVYPIEDTEHIGVKTDEGTDPDSLTGVDEQNEDRMSGTPDSI